MRNDEQRAKRSIFSRWHYVDCVCLRTSYSCLENLNAQVKKKFMPEELSRNQSILRFDVILQHDWPIEQCFLYIRVFLSGKTKSPRVDLFIHWLRQQITNTCRKHFSRSYKNRSMLFKETCMNLEKPLTAYVNLLSCFLE